MLLQERRRELGTGGLNNEGGSRGGGQTQNLTSQNSNLNRHTRAPEHCAPITTPACLHCLSCAATSARKDKPCPSNHGSIRPLHFRRARGAHRFVALPELARGWELKVTHVRS